MVKKVLRIYKTKYFGRRYKSTKSPSFRWIATDWYKFCKHPLTCFRIVFADFLVHTVKLKPIIKDQIPGKLVTSGISDVATASVHSEKTWAKKWIMIIIIIIIIIIMNKSQELTIFHGRQKLTSAKN